jgi:tRNA dimethylallyltransferase
LLVIAGPTASGKSSLAVEVSERLTGEIVSADAFAVYRGLDIGTDKPDRATLDRVRHHLVNVADPRERYSAGTFARDAAEAIDDILRRGRLPIVAGGTHFYIRALLLGLFPSQPHDPKLRAALASSWKDDPGRLFDRLRQVDPAAAERIGPKDRQRILRALEVYELTGTSITEQWRQHRQRVRYRALIAVPDHPRDRLYARINSRVDSMFASGLEDEVHRLLASGVPSDGHALKAIGYRQVVAMIDGLFDRPTAIEQTKQASRKLAKRQLTWLRSLQEAPPNWVPPPDQGGTEAIIGLWDHHTGGSREP